MMFDKWCFNAPEKFHMFNYASRYVTALTYWKYKPWYLQDASLKSYKNILSFNYSLHECRINTENIELGVIGTLSLSLT